MVMGEQTLATQVAVIGGGPGGYAAAFRAADLGLDVTLIDAEPQLGGICLLQTERLVGMGIVGPGSRS
jgi:dihydrolipoyl dehydrogenase